MLQIKEIERVLREPIEDVEFYVICFQATLYHLGKIAMALPFAGRHLKRLRWRTIIFVDPADTQADYAHAQMIGIVASERLAKALTYTIQTIWSYRDKVINSARS